MENSIFPVNKVMTKICYSNNQVVTLTCHLLNLIKKGKGSVYSIVNTTSHTTKLQFTSFLPDILNKPT